MYSKSNCLTKELGDSQVKWVNSLRQQRSGGGGELTDAP